MHIETEHFRLRRLEPADLDALYTYRNDSCVTAGLGGFSTGYSRQDLAGWLAAHAARTDEVLWCIAERESDHCLGHVGIYRIDPRVGCCEFAILIGDKSWWGKGAAREISAAVFDYAFRQLNLHRIAISILETNSRSLRAYESLGFVHEGRLRDAQYRDGRRIDILLLALLRPDYEGLRR